MAGNINTINLDGAELFNECLAQATLIVKQVLPSHYSNQTPDVEWDVKDLINHMLGILKSVETTLSDSGIETADDILADTTIDQAALDVNVHWQLAADKAEAAIAEADLEDTIQSGSQQMQLEDFLIELAGVLLIHAWDLGEAIGMPVTFKPRVAEAVMETTIIPNKSRLSSQTMFAESISPPANADLQARLLALFGRSYGWRATA